MLNGKAKEKFEKWLMNGNDGVSNFGRTIELTRVYFLSLKETCQQALIIDFFDSVGIYIGIVRFNVGSGYFESRIHYQGGLFFTSISRTEATTQAIEKASEIFNNLHNEKRNYKRV